MLKRGASSIRPAKSATGCQQLLTMGRCRCARCDRRRSGLKFCRLSDIVVALIYIGVAGFVLDRLVAAWRRGWPVAERRTLLGGRPIDGASDQGEIICVCFQVGEARIGAAIHSGAATAQAIGIKLGAPVNCRPPLSGPLPRCGRRLS